MANHKSAAKRARQDIKKAANNSQTKKAVRTQEKKLRVAIDAKDKSAAQTELVSYCSKLDKAASKGAIHRNQAARKTSRLSSAVSAI